MKALGVDNPGVLSLVQDRGRFGHHRIGLTTGGPLDAEAMAWANRLVHNPPGASVIESSFGGLELAASGSLVVAVTGGDGAVLLNGEQCERWRSYRLRDGDRLSLEYCEKFCRRYVAVAGGIDLPAQFDSTATVVREGIGGLCGQRLQDGDRLPVGDAGDDLPLLRLSSPPVYSDSVCLRVIPGYQYTDFAPLQRRRFFAGEFEVTDRADRMGYRLEGPAIECDLDGILSEGICQGAIQVPADGQPIVLLQDRQTIGGYPKIGAALSLDTARLAQLMPGAVVRFREITQFDAHNALQLSAARMASTPLETCHE